MIQETIATMAAGLYSALAQGKGTIGATTMSAHKVPPKRIEEPHPGSAANKPMLKTPPATESHHTGYRKHEREARPRAVTTLICEKEGAIYRRPRARHLRHTAEGKLGLK